MRIIGDLIHPFLMYLTNAILVIIELYRYILREIRNYFGERGIHTASTCPEERIFMCFAFPLNSKPFSKFEILHRKRPGTGFLGDLKHSIHQSRCLE